MFYVTLSVAKSRIWCCTNILTKYKVLWQHAVKTLCCTPRSSHLTDAAFRYRCVFIFISEGTVLSVLLIRGQNISLVTWSCMSGQRECTQFSFKSCFFSEWNSFCANIFNPFFRLSLHSEWPWLVRRVVSDSWNELTNTAIYILQLSLFLEKNNTRYSHLLMQLCTYYSPLGMTYWWVYSHEN